MPGSGALLPGGDPRSVVEASVTHLILINPMLYSGTIAQFVASFMIISLKAFGERS